MANDRTPEPTEGGGIIGALFAAVFAAAVLFLLDWFPTWTNAVLVVVIAAAVWRYGDDFTARILTGVRWLWPF